MVPSNPISVTYRWHVRNILLLNNITLRKAISKDTFNTKGLTIIVRNTLYKEVADTLE